MTKAEIVSEIAKRTGMTCTTVSVCVETFIDVIKDALSNGASVFIRGFGSFLIRYRKEKKVRDIGRDTSFISPAHNIPVFKPSKEFKKLIY